VPTPTEGPYEVCVDAYSSRQAAKYVTAESLSLRELPGETWRMLATREFLLAAGIPVALLVIGELMPADWHRAQTAGQALSGVAVVWLVVAMTVLLRFGKTVGIACYATDAGTGGKTLAGGMRLKVVPAKRLVRLAGVLVAPDHRGRGIFSALLLALFKIVDRSRLANPPSPAVPIRIAVFAPAHPASHKMIQRYFDGRQELTVGGPSSDLLLGNIAKLEDELAGLAARGLCFTLSISTVDWEL
jgi:GNAT superfamily N-acetyltransferase